MKLYKLTNQNNETRNHTLWGENVSHSVPGEGKLCGPGWLHAYEHPLIAVFINPVHGNIINPRLWLAEGEIGVRNGELKCGTAKLTTIRKLKLPELTLEFRAAVAIKLALEVYDHPEFVNWADNWLSGKACSAGAANAAYAAARAAAYAARAAARAAAYAARAAADAGAAGAAGAAYAAARAANAAARAADAVVYTAAYAANAAANAAAVKLPFLNTLIATAQEMGIGYSLG